MPQPVVLLGPQRLRPTLVSAVEALELRGGIAAVTAGWEDREDEIDELRAHLGRRVVNLQLHRRTEEIFLRDREFFVAYRERRLRLREMQGLYRRRLTGQMDALLALLRAAGRPDIVEPARTEALEAVRRLDAWHLARVRDELAQFEAAWRPEERDAISTHRAQVAALLGDCDALAIAGGNVAVLLNRLRLLGVDALLRAKPVLAWSAGAMVLAESVVIYHDSPPQGPGFPEVFAPGLSLVHGALPLPHAHRRLRLEDTERVSVFARRFAPLECLALDDGARLVWRDGRAQVVDGVHSLLPDGSLREERP